MPPGDIPTQSRLAIVPLAATPRALGHLQDVTTFLRSFEPIREGFGGEFPISSTLMSQVTRRTPPDNPDNYDSENTEGDMYGMVCIDVYCIYSIFEYIYSIYILYINILYNIKLLN